MGESRVAGSDFLVLDPSEVPARGLTGWLLAGLRSAIQDGRLAVGSALPPTRSLAADLRVSRGLVVEVYRRLADEGLIRSQVGSGTVVAARLMAAPAPRFTTGAAPGKQGVTGGQVPPDARSAPRSRIGHADSSGTMLVLPPDRSEPVELDLSPGVPDLSAFPRAAWSRAERQVLDRMQAADLGYGDPRGAPPLRRALSEWLARTRGVDVDPDGILVVAGVAQSLALICQVLARQGNQAVAVEDPGSRGARDQLAYWGMDTVPVPVDEHGLDVAALVRTGVRAVLVTPAHQYPTGVVLSPHRRRQLLDWVADGGLVIEDDYDAEHRYDRAPVPALQARAPGRIAYTGSTSKALAPGMRLGWLVPPAELYQELTVARHQADLGSPALPQLVLAELIGSGAYGRHLRAVRVRQRQRRDAMLEAIAQHLPEARVEGVAAGLHLLLTLPSEVGSDLDLVDRIAKAGVRVQPLSWHRQLDGPPGLLLGYAALTADRLREAIRRIGAAVRNNRA